MIPYLKLGAVAVAAAACFGGGYKVAVWRATAAELERVESEREAARLRNAKAAKAASKYEADREAIESRLRAAQARLSSALAVPVPQCPGVELGRIVVPAAALAGLRDAAGQLDSDAPEPGPAVPGGAADPGK